MKYLRVIVIMLLAVSGQLSASEVGFGGIQLLDGYSVNRTRAVDAAAWTIEGKNGFEIQFEAGPNEGSWAERRDQNEYSWYREQMIHGYDVRFAVVKAGLKTQWEPNESRGLAPGNILLVTFLLEGSESDHTANFSAKVADQRELADALLMVVTFDPSKGSF